MLDWESGDLELNFILTTNSPKSGPRPQLHHSENQGSISETRRNTKCQRRFMST